MMNLKKKKNLIMCATLLLCVIALYIYQFCMQNNEHTSLRAAQYITDEQNMQYCIKKNDTVQIDYR